MQRGWHIKLQPGTVKPHVSKSLRGDGSYCILFDGGICFTWSWTDAVRWAKSIYTQTIANRLEAA